MPSSKGVWVDPPFRVYRYGSRTDRLVGRVGRRRARSGRGDSCVVCRYGRVDYCSGRVGRRGDCIVRHDGRGGDRFDRRVDCCADRAGRHRGFV